MSNSISWRAARVDANLTLKEVSEIIGKAAATISDYETGKSIPNLVVAKKLAKLYGVSLDAIRTPEEDVAV